MESDRIIKEIARGDRLAGKWLLDAYQVKVYNICFSMVHNLHDAEDLTQEVFIEVLKNIGSFRGDSQLGTWIYRIAVNRSLNFLRNSKKRKWLNYIDELLSVKDQGIKGLSYQTEPFEASDNKRLLQKALNSLPEKQKTAFTLNKINDLSYKEVAEIMNISHANVETLIHRAKMRLQRALRVMNYE